MANKNTKERINNIQIITDSCSDLPLEARGPFNIDYVDFSIYLKGKEVKPGLDWTGISQEDFYDELRNGTSIYTLSATEHEIRLKLESYLKQGIDVLFITCSSRVSNTNQKARKIVTELQDIYPERKIEVIDSRNASAGQTIVVVETSKYLHLGHTFEECVEYANKIRDDVLQLVTVPSLTNMSKSGRISTRVANFANFMKIKPIITSDIEGNQVSLKNVKGLENVIEELVDMYISQVEPKMSTYLVHGGDTTIMNYVMNLLDKKGFHPKKVKIICLGAVVGVTSGPGTVGLFGTKKDNHIDKKTFKNVPTNL